MKPSKLIVEMPHKLSRKDKQAMKQWRMLLKELLSSETPGATPIENIPGEKKKTIKRRRPGGVK